jgi:hypothetical protein
MVDNYTIYLVNKSADTQQFWCFLEAPNELKSDPDVFANSNAALAVKPGARTLNRFVIPTQFVVGAGAANKPVGLGIRIVSSVTEDSNLTDKWDATYANVPPNMGPELDLSSAKAPANTIAISSNAFNKVANENSGWFSNQSFGIETDAGFIGMTWSPKPQQTRTLTPKLTFYIAVGSYGSNSLASWTEVSNGSATVTAPGNFQFNECTVTYNPDGSWVVTKGKPSLMLAANTQLAAMALLQGGSAETGTQVDVLDSVHWDTMLSATEDYTYLSGTISVTAALAAGFTYFLLSGVTFVLTNQTENGQTRFRFSYRGDWSSRAIKDLFQAGATLLFG